MSLCAQIIENFAQFLLNFDFFIKIAENSCENVVKSKRELGMLNYRS